jgi:hypothetical protein
MTDRDFQEWVIGCSRNTQSSSLKGSRRELVEKQRVMERTFRQAFYGKAVIRLSRIGREGDSIQGATAHATFGERQTGKVIARGDTVVALRATVWKVVLGSIGNVLLRIPANPITHSGNTRSEKRGVRMRFIFGFDEGKGL